jgi:hypothetical protein
VVTACTHAQTSSRAAGGRQQRRSSEAAGIDQRQPNDETESRQADSSQNPNPTPPRVVSTAST